MLGVQEGGRDSSWEVAACPDCVVSPSLGLPPTLRDGVVWWRCGRCTLR